MKQVGALAATAALLLAGSFVLAQEDAEKKKWSNKAELAVVMTGGNSESTTIAVSDEFKIKLNGGELQINFGFLDGETTTRTAANVDGELVVTETTEDSAEKRYLNGKYSNVITNGLRWYVSGGWDRDRLAGINNRYKVGAGVGYEFINDERNKLTGELGADYTDENRIGGTVPMDDSFAGARGFVGYERKLSETATFNAEAELLQNLDESDDLRVNAKVSVTASLTEALALKVGYTVNYDKSPVVQELTAVGFEPVLFEFDETDTIFAASLVINY